LLGMVIEDKAGLYISWSLSLACLSLLLLLLLLLTTLFPLNSVRREEAGKVRVSDSCYCYNHDSQI